jgi:lysyl endopeptidase
MNCLPVTTSFLRAILAIAMAWTATAHAATAVPGVADRAITSVPPAEFRGPTVARRTALVSPVSTPARRVDLASPMAVEAESMRAYNQAAAAAGKGLPLAIGFGREVPDEAREVSLASLDWRTDAGGGKSARIELASTGAAAMRVALVLQSAPPGVAFRFAGAADAVAFGPVAAAAIAQASAQGGMFWTPVLAGETAVIEISADPDAVLDGAVLQLVRVSHMLAEGAQLRSLSPAVQKATGIGAAGACEVDVACIAPTNAAAASLAKSVAKLQFVADNGRSFVCTGTLLNDSAQSFTPYLFSASHCLESAAIARTLNTYWFYDATTCGSKTAPPYVHLTGGATLLGRSQDRDWSIVRLNETPPAGTLFAAWRAAPIAVGTPIASLHHPEGDLGKWSAGKVTGDVFLDDAFVYSGFTEVVWNQGVTEGGSSGGAVVTLAPAGGYYEVRGGLYAGASSCSVPGAPDYFSHLETALPLMREYLTPNAANPTGTVAAVEFYNATLDHYFLSTNPVEIANLDTGRTTGWVRTGLRFLAYDNPQPGASPVCRFYRAPAFGDSHFYSASPAECAATAAAHPADWVYESPNVFYVKLPNTATGACPTGTTAVYRYFNRATTNHRYTMEIVVRDRLDASPLWTPEGYGPGPFYPVMCAATQ